MAFVGHQNMFSIGQPVLILTLDDTLVEFLDLIAQHEFLTKDV
jgi:hypothetical protein